MILVGITGSIASGKSFISSILRKKGYLVIDADSVSKSILFKSEKVKLSFPESIENNQISLELLRKIVFNDKSKLKLLESILHPLVRKEIKKTISLHSIRNIIFMEVPLLFETGYNKFLDYTICVTVPYNIRKQRAEARGVSKSNFEAIYKRQFNEHKKISKSDYVIYGGMGKSFATRQIDKILDLMFTIQKI